MSTPYLLTVPRVAPGQSITDGGPAATVAVDKFHARSSDHRPTTRVRVAHDGRSLLLRFDVNDRYVLARATEHQQMVCRDSCVEFFVQPLAGKGYFNFETNCGGTMLVYYVEDWTRTDTGLAKRQPFLPSDIAQIAISGSMPKIVWPERAEPTDWSMELRIPLAVMEAYVGPIGPLAGRTFRANFFKCADASSHPHWATWSPIGEELNFHQPQYFGSLLFE